MSPVGLDNVVLLGVDGGATEIKVHAVACDDLSAPTAFDLRPENASRCYERLPGFEPMPVKEQLAARDAGAVDRSDLEQTQADSWVRAAGEAITEVAQACQAQRVLIGIGMPGLKTPDGRGINVINNGPRIPDYLDRLENHLKQAGLQLANAIAALGSDADYCGLGEEYAREGLFRDVRHAYYLGGGTGLADALKLNGRLVRFDEARSWILKSWQMQNRMGVSYEQLISARAINEGYLQRIPPESAPPEPPFPEHAAADGDPIAVEWMKTVALATAELIFERLITIKNGRDEAPHHSPTYLELRRDHPFRGIIAERVIIGQRLGLIFGDERFGRVFGRKVDSYLADLIDNADDHQLASRCLDDGRLRSGFVQASQLRAAPAIGAAVAATQARLSS